MKDKIIDVLKAMTGYADDPIRCLMVPSYDDGTIALRRWIESWGLENIQIYVGDEAQHERAVTILNGPGRATKLLLFLGHGKAAGLLTKPQIGKASSPVCDDDHGCLLDTEDLNSNLKSVHIVAWACEAGKYFGPKVATLQASCFLGFNGPLNMVIEHEESEELWSSFVRELFQLVAQRGNIESFDAEWVARKAMAIRREIINGERDTGVYNRINTIFLRAAAKNAVVQVSEG